MQMVEGTLKTRLFVYIGLIILGGAFFSHYKNKAQTITRTAQQELIGALRQQETALIAAAGKSGQSAHALVKAGMDLLNKNNDVAGVLLTAGSILDPQYRDAALYTGYAALAKADGLWDQDSNYARDLTKRAADSLENAAKIDPINAYTFELLSVAYENLGESQKAQEAKAKFEELSKK